MTLEHLGAKREIAVTFLADCYAIASNGVSSTVRVTTGESGALQLVVDGETLTAHVVMVADRITVFIGGHVYPYRAPDPLAPLDRESGGGDRVFAPVPGVVKLVSATAGQNVAKGDRLIVIESMKMEYSLTAPRDGVVETVTAIAGDRVDEGALLLALKPSKA